MSGPLGPMGLQGPQGPRGPEGPEGRWTMTNYRFTLPAIQRMPLTDISMPNLPNLPKLHTTDVHVFRKLDNEHNTYIFRDLNMERKKWLKRSQEDLEDEELDKIQAIRDGKGPEDGLSNVPGGPGSGTSGMGVSDSFSPGGSVVDGGAPGSVIVPGVGAVSGSGAVVPPSISPPTVIEGSPSIKGVAVV